MRFRTTQTPPNRARSRIVAVAVALLLGLSSVSSATAFGGSTVAGRSILVDATNAGRRRSPVRPTSSSTTTSFSSSGAPRFRFLVASMAIPRGGGGGGDLERDPALESAADASSTDAAATATTTTPTTPRFASVLASPPVAVVSSVLKPAVALYCAALAKRPVATNCATAAVLSVTSDAIAQRLERRRAADPADGLRRRHDKSRSSWMALWGWVVSGLVIHYWMVFLNDLFPPGGLTVVGALKKVGVNQLVMSPGLNALFFAFATYTRGDIGGGGKLAFLKRKLSVDLVPTIKRSCVYWGTIQMVNFLLIPPAFAVLYTNVGFLLWTTYISLVGYRKVAAAAAASSDQ